MLSVDVASTNLLDKRNTSYYYLTQGEQMLTNPEKTRILHFNNYGHVGLTIASQETPGHNDWFVLGMSLAHKHDNGSRFMGKCFAEERLMEGLEDPYLETHRRELAAKISNSNPPIRGEKGYYIIFGLENVKRIVSYLRYADKCWSFSKKNSTYHRAFFELPKLWERHINGFVSPEKRYGETLFHNILRNFGLQDFFIKK
jgi:hypothetical protein